MHRPTLALLLTLALVSTVSAATKRRAASPDRCSVAVAPAQLSFPSAGGHATVAVTVNGGCSWTPVASAAWITAGPAGNTLSVDVAANAATTARNGIIHVRGAVIVVTQAANQIPNLLTNAGFDSSITQWSENFSGPGSATWANSSPVIAPGPSTGAALITSTQARSGHQLSQCVAVTGGKRYEAGTKVLIPSGQSAGVINFAVYEYWVPDCLVSAGYHGSRVLTAASPLGSWFDQSVTWFTDFGTKSILVVIGAGGSNEPPFSAWFDDVYIREKP